MDNIAEEILKTERVLLKRILGVRKSTPNELIYIEVGLADFVSKIKSRKLTFFNRICNFDLRESSISRILNMCANLP